MTAQTVRKPASEIPPELELVLCCARAKQDATLQERMRNLADQEADWARVLAMAERHRLLPLLFEHLSALDAWQTNREFRDKLTEDVRASGRNSLHLLAEMLRLEAIFQAERLPVIPYKGPVLAWLAYGSISRRMFGDLDFAVPQQHIPRLTALLEAAGYQPQFDPNEVHAGQEDHAPGQYPFVLQGRAVLTEVHTERTLRYFPRPLDFEGMFSRLIPVEIARQKVRTFSAEDTLVMLCVHGAKHFWERLLWVADVAALIRSLPVDWPLAMNLAEELRSARVFLLGLYLAGEWLGAPVPQNLLERARKDRKIPSLAARISERWIEGSGGEEGVVARAAFRIQSRDGIGQGILHTLHLATSPTETDRRSVQLPGSLALLYAFARPWRLLREYGLGLRDRPKKI